MGDPTVDPAVASRHLAAIGRLDHVRRLRRRLAVALAGATALASGGGLAWAGNLPGPAQRAAHHVFGAVGIEVPPGHDRVVDAAHCPDGTIDPETGEAYTNHGQYVRDHTDDHTAGQADCGKPRKAVEHPNGTGADDELTGEINGEEHGQGKAFGKDHGTGKPDGVEEGVGTDELTPEIGPPSEVPPQEPGESDATTPTDPGEGEGSPPSSVPVGSPTGS